MNTKNTDPFVLYILMRNDLPSMNVGRCAAQASHASNAFIYEFGKRKDVREWQNSTDQGFGTAIILSASTKDIQDVLDVCEDVDVNIPIRWVIDPEYGMSVSTEIFPFIAHTIQVCPAVHKTDGNVVFFRSEKTCAYVFGKKSTISQFVGHLPLFPEKTI